MISGDGVSEAAQDVGAFDIVDFGELFVGGFEERRVMDVSGFVFPFVLE